MSDHGEVVPNSEDEAANVNVAPGQPNIQDLYKLLQQSIQENTKFQLVVKDEIMSLKNNVNNNNDRVKNVNKTNNDAISKSDVNDFLNSFTQIKKQFSNSSDNNSNSSSDYETHNNNCDSDNNSGDNDSNDSDVHSPRHKFVENRTKKSSYRRETIIDKIASQADRSKNNIIMYQQQPSFDHIQLSKLTCFHVLRFVGEIVDYQDRFNITIKPTQLVTTQVKSIIIAHNSNRGITELNFSNLSTKEFLLALQRATRPLDRTQFYNNIMKNVDFQIPRNYHPSPIYFRPLYDALQIYRTDFTRYYEFMRDKKGKNVPKIENKQNGLIKLFLSKIPFGYGDKIFQKLKSNKFTDFSDFLNEFYKKVEQQYDISCLSSAMNQNFDKPTQEVHFSSTPTTKPTYDRRVQKIHNLEQPQNSVDINNNTNNLDNVYDDRELGFPAFFNQSDGYESDFSKSVPLQDEDENDEEQEQVPTSRVEHPSTNNIKSECVNAFGDNNRLSSLQPKAKSDLPNGCFHESFNDPITTNPPILLPSYQSSVIASPTNNISFDIPIVAGFTLELNLPSNQHHLSFIHLDIFSFHFSSHHIFFILEYFVSVYLITDIRYVFIFDPGGYELFSDVIYFAYVHVLQSFPYSLHIISSSVYILST